MKILKPRWPAPDPEAQRVRRDLLARACDPRTQVAAVWAELESAYVTADEVKIERARSRLRQLVNQ